MRQKLFGGWALPEPAGGAYNALSLYPQLDTTIRAPGKGKGNGKVGTEWKK